MIRSWREQSEKINYNAEIYGFILDEHLLYIEGGEVKPLNRSKSMN